MFFVLSTIPESQKLKYSEKQESKCLSLEGLPSYPTLEQRKGIIKSSGTRNKVSQLGNKSYRFHAPPHKCGREAGTCRNKDTHMNTYEHVCTTILLVVVFSSCVCYKEES